MGSCPKANCTSKRRRMGLENRNSPLPWPVNLCFQHPLFGDLTAYTQKIRRRRRTITPLFHGPLVRFFTDTSYGQTPVNFEEVLGHSPPLRPEKAPAPG